MRMERGLAFPDADKFMVGQVRFDGTYQIENLQAGLKYVTNFDCAIDGGAHIGTWSKVMAQSFARVIAVEPSADTCECLLLNLEKVANVDVRNVALGDAPGTVRMHLDADQKLRANTGARFTKPGGDIPVETIDSWNLSSLGFLKLDVEGSEYVALHGAVETITRCKPIVLFENKFLWSKNFGLPKDSVSRLLTGLRYRMVDRVSRDEIWTHR